MRYIDSSEDIKVLPWIVVETGTLYIRRGHFIVSMSPLLIISMAEVVSNLEPGIDV